MPASALQNLADRASDIILGKRHQVELSLACMLARGHLLIEDVPGVGKTTLAHLLARLFGLRFSRIQFTSDLLPADILGVSIYRREDSRFEFHPGPVFSQVVLADEVNRATPKTQSALLEAMEERQVSLDGHTRTLPTPFFVVATQNPASQIGTFALPESQLDRFLMRIRLGFPDAEAERALLRGQDRRVLLEEMRAVADPDALLAWQAEAAAVHAADALIDYVQALIRFTRECGRYRQGLSPRAGLGLLAAARAWALLQGRAHVLPEDVQAVLPGVALHRLQPLDGLSGDETAQMRELIQAVALP